MNTASLQKLSLETLQALKSAIKVEIDRRVNYSLRAGSFVKFTNSKTGELVYLQVSRVNGQSISGFEADALLRVNPLRRWRVGKSMVTPVDMASAKRADRLASA